MLIMRTLRSTMALQSRPFYHKPLTPHPSITKKIVNKIHYSSHVISAPISNYVPLPLKMLGYPALEFPAQI